MTPPVHAVRKHVCAVHTDPPCGVPAALYPAGWRCLPPDSRRDHPLTPEPSPTPEPEEATHA